MRHPKFSAPITEHHPVAKFSIPGHQALVPRSACVRSGALVGAWRLWCPGGRVSALVRWWARGGFGALVGACPLWCAGGRVAALVPRSACVRSGALVGAWRLWCPGGRVSALVRWWARGGFGALVGVCPLWCAGGRVAALVVRSACVRSGGPRGRVSALVGKDGRQRRERFEQFGLEPRQGRSSDEFRKIGLEAV